MATVGFDGGEQAAVDDVSAMTPLDQGESVLVEPADWGAAEDWSDWRCFAD